MNGAREGPRLDLERLLATLADSIGRPVPPSLASGLGRAREVSDMATLNAAAECCAAALAGPTAGVRARGGTQPLGAAAGTAWRQNSRSLGGRHA